MYIMNCYSALKGEGSPVIYDNMDTPGVYYAKWNTPGTGRQILHDLIYVCNLKKLKLLSQRVEWWLLGLWSGMLGEMRRCYSKSTKF